MKITESQLRKMVRKMLIELTPSTAAGGTKRKVPYGKKSSDLQSKEKAWRSADTSYRKAKDTSTTAKKSYDTAKADLDKHTKAEPTKFGATEYTYTNTVTGKKVTTTTDPGKMGEYTIPALGGGAELKVTSTHYFPEEGTEIKSKVTKVKVPKEMITQIQSDLDKWTGYAKET